MVYDLYIYDDVQADWYDWWTGEKQESETSANHYREIIAQIPGNAQINLYINSLGGSVKEGLGIYTQLKRHTAYKVGYNDGYACSIASVILMACDKVIMPKNTLIMLHFAWWWACGNPAQLRKSADDLDVINEATMQSYLMKAGDKLTKDVLLGLLTAESWLTAESCMQYGLIDEYDDQEADMTAARQKLEATQAAATQRGKDNPAAAFFADFAAAALAKLPGTAAPVPVSAPAAFCGVDTGAAGGDRTTYAQMPPAADPPPASGAAATPPTPIAGITAPIVEPAQKKRTRPGTQTAKHDGCRRFCASASRFLGLKFLFRRKILCL